MNNLDSEQKKNRLLYRELFFKANEGFKEQINSLKANLFCKNQKICCKIRYANLSPAEIFALKQEGEEISIEYTELFMPYGAGKDFDYEKNNQIDLKLNNELAANANGEYVSTILSKHSGPTYFYYCKNLNERNECISPKKYYLCNFPASVSTILPKECGFREWQRLALEKIKNEMSRDVLKKLREIDDYRYKFRCNRTGTCCRLACSEFSFEELKEKAKNGDNFASQFVSIFIPYESIGEAREIFPEYVDLVLSRTDDDEKVYFYHCFHVTDDNICPIYDDRPQICRDFPNNPLSILPPECGYCEWKDDVMVASMLLHSLIEIIEYNQKKIENALQD